MVNSYNVIDTLSNTTVITVKTFHNGLLSLFSDVCQTEYSLELDIYIVTIPKSQIHPNKLKKLLSIFAR